MEKNNNEFVAMNLWQLKISWKLKIADWLSCVWSSYARWTTTFFIKKFFLFFLLYFIVFLQYQ